MFDPKKPCITRGSGYPVEILRVFDTPDNRGQQIVGVYVDSDGDRNIEHWCIGGRYMALQDGPIDLINKPAAPVYSSHRNVVHKISGEFGETQMAYAFAQSETSAQHIAEALNDYERNQPRTGGH